MFEIFECDVCGESCLNLRNVDTEGGGTMRICKACRLED